MPSIRTLSLIERIRDDHPDGPKLKAAATAALSAAEGFAAKRDELSRSGRLTSAGQQEALREALETKFARDLAHAQRTINEAQGRLNTLKNAVTVRTAADPTDVVGMLQQMELRTFIATLPLAERVKFVLESTDARVASAVLQAPRELTGLPTEVYAAVESAHQEKVFGKELAEITALEEIVGEAQAAAAVARIDLLDVSGLTPRSFENIMQPIEQRAGAPWLIRDRRHDGTEKVLIVEPGKATYREATEDERRDGVFYANLAEYEAAQAA